MVKNTDNEPDSLVEIIIKNNISYIPKISVIIPVFNTELYLQQCIETIINQTLKDIEIICIDDDSSGNSLNMLIEYSRKDKRITVLKQNKFNAGVARNAGLSIAKGEYLSFIDSDERFELNTLEKMYNKISSLKADIIICRCKSMDFETGKFNERILDYSLKLNLIPKKNTFSPSDIPKYIFQFCEGWTWDKLFRSDFIRQNNIKFQSLINTNEQEFTFIALCLAKSITTINERLVIKRYKQNNLLSTNRNQNSTCFFSALEKIKCYLEKKGLFNSVKDSFWRYFFDFNIYQLKKLDQESKVNLYNILHKKLNLWNYNDISSLDFYMHSSLHYIKNHNIFPNINIGYAFNRKFFELCLVSISSILINHEYENINIFLLYNGITETEIRKIKELKEIRNFTLQTMFISDEECNDYPLAEWLSKETWYRCLFADKFPNIDKILYLDSDIIIRKSLLPLWGISLNNKLIAGVEDVSKSKDQAKKFNLKDNLYVNAGVLLINTKKWRQVKFFNKISNYVKINKKLPYADQDAINFLSDNQKIRLNPEFNYMEVWWRKNKCQYDYDYLKLYMQKDPTIIHFTGVKPNNKMCNNSFRSEFLYYYNITNSLNKKHLIS